MGLIIDQVKRTPSASHDLCEGRIVYISEDLGVIGPSYGDTWLGKVYQPLLELRQILLGQREPG